MRLAALLLLAVVAGAACDRGRTLRVRKEVLTRMPIPWRRPSINIANDGFHVTYSVRVDDGYYVVTPQGRGPIYAEVSPPLFAKESDRVFYWGMHPGDDGTKRFDVIAAGTVVPTPFVEAIDLAEPSGGARWAASGIVGAAPGGAQDALATVVIDGKEVGRSAAASRLAFSPDGAHVAWIARETNGRAQVIVDGAVVRTSEASPPPPDGPRFDELASVTYLSDGRLIALVPEGDGWVLWRGDEQLGRFGQNLIPGRTFLLADQTTPASIVAGSLVTAAKAPVAVWWERMPGLAERWRVVRDGAAIDGMECASYWPTQPPVLTDDGAHVASVCPTPSEVTVPLGRRWVMLDGRRFGPYIETWTLGIAENGSAVAYGGAESLPIMTWRFFVNGVPRARPMELVWRPRLSPDGAHLFWMGGPEHGRRHIGIDRRTITGFDDVMYGPEFPDPHTAVWVIRRGRKIARIVATF